jgi:mono/diheme cytochrome c family protein
MKKLFLGLVVLAVIAAVTLWILSRPAPLLDDAMAGLTGNASRGETVFWAGGCASCHADPEAKAEAKLILSGGYRIESPFGAFIAPNISPGPAGIGDWSAQDLANALIAGVSPEGAHLYPSLPYTTYRQMTLQDVADLMAYLETLPVSHVPSQPHELGFPFNIRRGLGLWKRINLSSDWVLADASTPELERGRYLVEALGHCAECHTPRDATGGLDRSRWMQGAPNPSGKGEIPAIDPRSLKWSAGDIAYYLESGFTPDYDSAGGQMTKVVESMSQLSAEDRNAIAAYLKALPPAGG